jgi:hypothetical protein
MTSRLKLPLCLLALLVLALPATAEAKYRVGIGEQNSNVFLDPNWKSTKLKKVRYMVPWDYAKTSWQAAEVDLYMQRAHAAKQDVLVAFTARRGCWVNSRYKRTKACRAPSPSTYLKAFRGFDDRYPWVRNYSAWNEINHKSQPTYKSPKRAAQYYNTLAKECKKATRKCRVMAADMLDTSNMIKYLKRFKRFVKGPAPKLWGLHNYQDVNRFTSQDTLAMLRNVRGELWLTETGGMAAFGKSFKYSTSRQNRATKWMIKLANRYGTHKARGTRARLTRLFVYSWYGLKKPKTRKAKRNPPFDAGLVGQTGSPRPAYKTFKKVAKHHL